MTKKKYLFGVTFDDRGVYADGTNGHQHCRTVLGNILNSAWENCRRPYSISDSHVAKVVSALYGDMSDDAAEEEEALDILNEHFCSPGTWFEFVGGDLQLIDETMESGQE